MIGLLVGLLLLSCLFGRTMGLIGGLAGGFLGVLVLTGMARTAANGELAALYSPGELAASAIPVVLVGALVASIAPYASAVASFAWGAGALLAVVAASRTGQAAHIVPLVLHAACAASLVCLARARAAALY